jgi:uncharacterized protein (TIGR02246 family)
MRFRFVHLIVSALFVATVALAQGDAEQAIREIPDRWAASFNEGDLETVVDLYAEDAIFIDAFGRFEGHEAIHQGLMTKLPVEVGEARIEIATDEVEVFDDAAYSMGTYAVSALDGSTLMAGSWSLISRLVDGTWKMDRHLVSILMQPPEADASQALGDLGHRWAELFNEGDFQGVADLYTEDAIVVNFDGRADEGREAIHEGLAQPLPEPLDQGTIAVTTEEAEVFGDTAYGMGEYVLSAPDGSVMMQGTYVAISKLVDGEWKMHRHVVNMLMPEPEADAP